MTEWGVEGCEGALCSLGDTSLVKWDVDSDVREHSYCELPKRSSPTSLRWNPHSSGGMLEFYFFFKSKNFDFVRKVLNDLMDVTP